LIFQLGYEDFEIQGQAANALEGMGPKILDTLRKTAEDTNKKQDVRDWCNRIARKIQANEKRYQVLLERLSSTDDETKESAEKEIITIGRPAIPYLLDSLKSDNKNLRKRARNILEVIGSEKEVRKWLADFQFEDGSVTDGFRFGFRKIPEKSLLDKGNPVLAALKWLARHQNPDGSWGACSFSNQCHGPRCPGTGDPEFDAGVTALSVLAFLGAGYSHLSKDEFLGSEKSGPLRFGDTVRNGLKWLMARQDPEGCVGGRGTKYMYNHAIAALALTEAYGMSATPLLKGSAQASIDFLIKAQNPDRAWRYTKQSGDNDTSITGWVIMALKSAEMADLKVDTKDCYEKAGKWFDEVSDPGNTMRVGYNGRASGKVFVPGKNEDFEHHEAMTAVGVLCRIFMTKDKKHPALDGIQLLVSDLPTSKSGRVDSYYWHYGTQAIYQFDGPEGELWQKWNEAFKRAVLTNQKGALEACAYGSWTSEDDRWGFEGGRVYTTAINALTLETPYRYPRVLK